VKVDPKQFMADGFTILRGVIDPGELEALRSGVETMVLREWPDGIPDGAFQPMMKGFYRHVDDSTSHVMELLLHENTLGVARQLMPRAKFVCPAYMFMILNPVRQMGPWFWHRDMSPPLEGPLQGLQEDFMANGPAVLQMNIALYDDKVLWVVPGSHNRPNTDEENVQLASVPHGYGHGQQPQGEKRHTPLPHSICVDLKAGDAVIYTNMILHWASDYTSKVLRRCILLGYRCFSGPRFYYEGVGVRKDQRDFTKYLSPRSREIFEHALVLHEEEVDTVEAIFRAVLDRDEMGFCKSLEKLHPGKPARMTCLIHLCKFIQRNIKSRDEVYGPRFSDDEFDLLRSRFAPLDEALKTDTPQYMPGFQIPGPTPYRLYELPPGFGIDQFVESWGN